MCYASQTECPAIFHRWCAITILAAYMGRRICFKHGHSTLHPNIYTLLIGSPGTKKSSAIKMGAKLLKLAGYTTFAAKKTRQEKFLQDLAEQSEALSNSSGTDYSDILDRNLFGDVNNDHSFNYDSQPPAETLVAADEFNNFIGLNNLDFISILGELWDYEGTYDYKLKNAKSIYIPNPTVTILGGNTPTGLSQAFPVDIVGQGFFSRLLLVFSEPTGIKYTFPPPPDEELQAALIAMLHDIKNKVLGELSLSPAAASLLDKIYKNWEKMEDIRFEYYANRRFTHLLKLCLVMVASRVGSSIEKEDVIEANTILTYTEQLMPKALGEFGRARNSISTHKIMEVLDNARLPITVQHLWKVLQQDFESRQQLIEILNDLQVADKIQSVNGGFLPKRKPMDLGIEGSVDWSLLTEYERALIL